MKDNLNLIPSTNDLVPYSRAGDAFHYRWAARRCLELIKPNTQLEKIIIEGSDEKIKAGEFVMDITEYYNLSDSKKKIEYYQLKHTTVRHDKPFHLSDFKVTIEGFSARFKQHVRDKSINRVTFSIITNRRIDENFKQYIALIANDELEKAHKRFLGTLKKYTKLSNKRLIQFCSLLHLEDSEGDYRLQKENLRLEMSLLQPGIIDSAQVESITSLVHE